MSQLRNDQKVLGIGLSKTGTTSLTKALNILGIRSVHFPHDAATFTELQRCEYRLTVLEEYQGVTDTPVAPFFVQLDRAWPDSKFILTVRDKASWLRSAERHWSGTREGCPATDPDFRAFVDFINACVYGCTHFDTERFSYVYDRHERHVAEYFADRPDDLLVLDICSGSQGWTELCGFLGVPVPDNAPFPHEYRAGRWPQMLTEATAEFVEVVPPGASVIMVDQEALGEGFMNGRRRVPFLEIDGHYAGCPADDGDAIRELERHRAAGAGFLAVAWPAFWWFEHYAEFAAELRRKFPCVLSSERLVVFDLRA